MLATSHVQMIRGNGQVLAVGLCKGCGKLFGFNPQSVPTHEDKPLCRECIASLVNAARIEAGKDAIVVEPDAYEAYREDNEAPLDVLKQRLAEFRDGYEMCSMIDHYPDVVRCREQFQPGIDRLTARIAELEGREDAA